MNKIYVKPEVEVISLEAIEDLMTEGTSSMGVDILDETDF